MSLYTFVLFIHVASALLLFIAFSIEWAAVTYLRESTTPEEAQLWLRFGRFAPVFNGPALAVLILTGGYLASVLGAMKFGWIPGSLIGIVVVMLLGIVINMPKMRAIRLAIPKGGAALSAALQNKSLPVSVRIRTFLALSIVFMMATKVKFEHCLLALLSGLILGLLFSLPVLRRKSA
ncbi:MAG TPA: hypothetical protein VKT53_04835 [Candidatus Acidoferrum sp.]|nr:hypothetical protein [Candidatus Acidoferrum sp.]